MSNGAVCVYVCVSPQDEDPGTKASAERIPGMIEAQAAAAVDEADAVIVVMDGQSGPCASDDDIMRWMRRNYPTKPLVLAVNKCESPTLGPIQVASFWEYGHEPIGISALSGTGTGELLDKLMEVTPKTASIIDETIKVSERHTRRSHAPSQSVDHGDNPAITAFAKHVRI